MNSAPVMENNDGAAGTGDGARDTMRRSGSSTAATTADTSPFDDATNPPIVYASGASEGSRRGFFALGKARTKLMAMLQSLWT